MNYIDPYYKIVEIECTIKKSIVFPKLNTDKNDGYSRCLITQDTRNKFDCTSIDCDDCIFSHQNYAMFIAVKEEKKGE